MNTIWLDERPVPNYPFDITIPTMCFFFCPESFHFQHSRQVGFLCIRVHTATHPPLKEKTSISPTMLSIAWEWLSTGKSNFHGSLCTHVWNNWWLWHSFPFFYFLKTASSYPDLALLVVNDNENNQQISVYYWANNVRWHQRTSGHYLTKVI